MTLSVKSLLCLRCSSFLSLQSCDHRRTSGSPQQQGYSSGTGTNDARQEILLYCNQEQKTLLPTARNITHNKQKNCYQIRTRYILLPMNRKMLSKNRNTAIKDKIPCYQRPEVLLSKTGNFAIKNKSISFQKQEILLPKTVIKL